jgi:hypothetical protein
MLRHAAFTKQKAAGSPRRTATRTLIFPTKCSSFGERLLPDFGQGCTNAPLPSPDLQTSLAGMI